MEDYEYFRRASKADYDDVISLVPDEVVGESLPDYFHMLMDNPLFEATVCILNNRIVGFGAVIFIDNGMTGGMMYARIHKKFRDRGIFRKIHYQLLKSHPELKYSVSSVLSNFQEVYRHIDRGYYKLLHTRKCAFYIGHKNTIDLNKKETCKGTKLVKESDLRQIISDKSLYPYLFENNRLPVYNVTYGLTESNVPIILKDKTSAVVSFMEDKIRTLLTFGSHFEQRDGNMFCNISIHGVIGHTLVTHVKQHIQSFIDLVQDSFTIEVLCNEVDFVDKVMAKIGLSKLEEPNRRTEVLFIEHQIPSQSKL